MDRHNLLIAFISLEIVLYCLSEEKKQFFERDEYISITFCDIYVGSRKKFRIINSNLKLKLHRLLKKNGRIMQLSNDLQ